MPFIKKERRTMVDKDQYFSVSRTPEGIQVGDRCYFYYKKMVDRWKANPRWTTAHEIYKEMMQTGSLGWDDETAYSLAWQVFFVKYVMKYEDQKEIENGEI